MKRREFITLLAGAAAWPLAARAQQSSIPAIGYLSGRSAESDVPMLAAFRRGLNETGYVAGKNVIIESRFADGQRDRLQVLAGDLVRRQVNVIVTGGGESAALAAKAATANIPIVFNAGGDPVHFGLVNSLNRPGGNITGVAALLSELVAKKLGLLRELVPKADAVAALVDPTDPSAASQISETQQAAHALGQQLVLLRASTDEEIDAAFAMLVRQQAAALLVNASPFFVTRAKHLIGLSARHLLPTIYFRREMADAGGLMSYGSIGRAVPSDLTALVATMGSPHSPLRQELEYGSGEAGRITTRPVMMDILKNDRPSSLHTLADRFTDQREV